MKFTRGSLALLIIILVIAADQILKIWVKTHFYLGEQLVITDWFRLLFVENNGMAFGMELGSKLFHSRFRIMLVAWLIWYVVKINRISQVASG